MPKRLSPIPLEPEGSAMTDKYAVIGNPIGHTKSPLIHLTFARQTGQDIDYTAIEGRIGGFREDAEAFRLAGGRGMNITAPLKLEAFEYATDLSEPARLAGAVNALKFEGDRIHAQNFDGVGLVSDIVHNLGYPMAGRRVLLLGAGGAARGAMLPFLKQKPARLLVVNRTVAKARTLVEQFKPYAEGEFSYCSYPELGDMHAQFDIWSTPPRPACAANSRQYIRASSRPAASPTNWPTARG
jgi:shikimate dehydrogenase